MNKLLFYSVIVLLGFSSCKKIGGEKISGIVSDDSTFVRLEGIDVQLYEFHDYSISNAKFLTSAMTNSNGKFEMKYHLGHRNPYFLRFVKNGYWSASHTIATSDDLKNMSMLMKEM